MGKDKKKILWIGDAVVTTGFARVNHSIIEHLDSEKFEVHHLGINYRGDPHNYNYSIYPAFLGGDVWGFGRLINLVQELKPDLIFILNDPWVISKYLDLLRENNVEIPVVVYFPVDAEEHDPAWYAGYNKVERACVYTEFGKRVVTEAESNFEDKIEVIPHGIDTSVFHELDGAYNRAGKLIKSGEEIARESLYPIKKQPGLKDAFIILNANRNQPRKRVDITLRAFKEFQEGKSDVRLYLHMGNRDVGYDIIKLANRYGFDDKLIVSTNGNQMPNIPDARLNEIYNGTTIGINTSMGEGWGLTNWEHGATRCAQIVPDHSACTEIWEDAGILIPTTQEYIYPETMTLAKVPDVYGTTEAMERLYESWSGDGELITELANKAYNKITSPEYNWKNISKQFENIFIDILGS